MGRGGPPEPEIVLGAARRSTTCSRSRAAGRHAASDHLETALVAGVPTVGCRRCGGGLAGAVGRLERRSRALDVAEALEPELVVLDGSGAALPPVAADRRVLVVGAHQDRSVATGYLNAYRALHRRPRRRDDGRGRTSPHAELAARRARARPRRACRSCACVLRPRPLEPVAGERVAFFGTAPAGAARAASRRISRDVHGADVDARLGEPLRPGRACATSSPASTPTSFVVELKAAAIDVVAEEAARRGRPDRARRERRRAAPRRARSSTPSSSGSPRRRRSACAEAVG